MTDTERMKDLWGVPNVDFEINIDAYHKLIDDDVWIAKEDMVVNGIYLVDGRNLDLGVWNGEGFDYMRRKWGHIYPDVEYHWDNGAPYGTVKPYILVGQYDGTGDF